MSSYAGRQPHLNEGRLLDDLRVFNRERIKPEIVMQSEGLSVPEHLLKSGYYCNNAVTVPVHAGIIGTQLYHQYLTALLQHSHNQQQTIQKTRFHSNI